MRFSSDMNYRVSPKPETIDKANTTTGELASPSDLPYAKVRAIGYWVDDAAPHLPDPRSMIDTNWDAKQRQRVAAFLNAGHEPSTGRGCSACRICGVANGFEDLTDGTYQWPEGLAHYVLDHSVRLPDEIVQHALNCVDPVQEVGVVDTAWWLSITS